MCWHQGVARQIRPELKAGLRVISDGPNKWKDVLETHVCIMKTWRYEAVILGLIMNTLETIAQAFVVVCVDLIWGLK